MSNEKDIRERLTRQQGTPASRQGEDESTDPRDEPRPQTIDFEGEGNNRGPEQARSVGVDASTRTDAGLLADDAIEEREGNYLISIGYGGSGKTTFQSFLAYYLTHVSEFTVDHVMEPSESAQGWAPLQIYNEWVQGWTEGKFPNYTVVGEQGLREISLHVQPRSGKRVPLEFTFLEVSGENLKEVIAGEHADPRMLETVYRFFENKSIKWTFILIIDPEWGERNDVLFDNFIKFLDVNFKDIRKDISLGVLVSKPQLALRDLKSRKKGYEHFQAMRGDLLETYLGSVAPRTMRIIEAWPNQAKTSIMTLNVGDVETGEDGTRVRRPDFRDIRQIFEWIYSQFTGSYIGPTLWQRVIAWLKE